MEAEGNKAEYCGTSLSEEEELWYTVYIGENIVWKIG